METAIPPTEDDRTFRHRVIQGEVNDENAWVMGGVSGHAGLFAPATDVARFAECMLRGGSPILRARHRRSSSPTASPRPSAPLAHWVGTHHRSHRRPARIFRRARSDTSASLALPCGSIPDRQLSVTLLTNRTWPDRSSQAIKQVRPLVHDAIVEAL